MELIYWLYTTSLKTMWDSRKLIWERYWRTVALNRAKLEGTWKYQPYESRWATDTRRSGAEKRMWDYTAPR